MDDAVPNAESNQKLGPILVITATANAFRAVLDGHFVVVSNGAANLNRVTRFRMPRRRQRIFQPCNCVAYTVGVLMTYRFLEMPNGIVTA